jgi:DNA invertase Pin-like site-specific DNA recombinase
MKTKLKAAAYLRVSTAGQAKEGESLSTQRSQIEEHCKRNNLELVEIYADEGLSGKKADRPELNRLLADAALKKFDLVIVTKLTRFGRSTVDLINNLDALDKSKILFASMKEQFDTSTAAGKLLRTVLVAIADFEHQTIREQMLENRTVRWARGDIKLGQNPFGYKWSKENKCFEIDEGEAAIYRTIVNWYLSGESYKSICIKLREMGVKCKKAPFAPATLGGVLKNPCYTGKYTVNKKVFKDKLVTKEDKPIEENIIIELPALITRIKWNKIQERIAFNIVKTKRTVSPEFFLRNVLICDECGAVIRPKLGGHKLKSKYYSCYWHNASKRTLEANGRKKCKLPHIPAHQIEDKVTYYLVNFLTFGSFNLRGKYVPSEIESMIDGQKFDDQILSLTSQLAHLKRALGRKATAKAQLFELLEMKGADKQLFLSQMAKLSDEEQLLASQIDDTQKRLAALESQKGDTAGMVSFIRNNRDWARNVGQKILDLSPADKQKLIESSVDGKISVSLAVEENGVEHWDINPKFVLNINMLEELKLGKFNPR